MSLKLTNAIMEAMLAKAIATAGPFDPVATFVCPITAVVDNGAATVQADVTRGIGDLAVGLAVTTWGPTHKLNDGRWAVDSPLLSWSPADSTEAQVVIGYELSTTNAGGTLKGFEVTGAPVPLVDEFSLYGVVVRVCIDPAGNFGVAVVVDG